MKATFTIIVGATSVAHAEEWQKSCNSQHLAKNDFTH
jgi:hypothetical protein